MKNNFELFIKGEHEDVIVLFAEAAAVSSKFCTEVMHGCMYRCNHVTVFQELFHK